VSESNPRCCAPALNRRVSMKYGIHAAVLLSLLAPVGYGQTSKPVSAATSLEMRASQAYGAGQNAVALPLLQDLAGKVKDQPDKLAAVQERIQVCQKQLDVPQTPIAPPAGPATGDNRKPLVKPAEGKTLEFASIKDLGNFDYDAEKGGNVPKYVMDLGGSKIKVRGFMIPLDQAENISQFALVPSLFACCFGQPPQIQHTVVVHCPAGKAVAYYPDEITVEGTLTVKEKREDGYIVSLFEMDAASVKPAPK
jgi:hypothetical protein